MPNVGRNVYGCSRALTLKQRGLARGSPATLESGERWERKKSKGVYLMWCWKVKKEEILRFRAWCGVVWCGEEREDLSSAGEKRRQMRRAM